MYLSTFNAISYISLAVTIHVSYRKISSLIKSFDARAMAGCTFTFPARASFRAKVLYRCRMRRGADERYLILDIVSTSQCMVHATPVTREPLPYIQLVPHIPSSPIITIRHRLILFSLQTHHLSSTTREGFPRYGKRGEQKPRTL
jgi:hypothetical protein